MVAVKDREQLIKDIEDVKHVKIKVPCELCGEDTEDVFKLDDFKVCSKCYEKAISHADEMRDAMKEDELMETLKDDDR